MKPVHFHLAAAFVMGVIAGVSYFGGAPVGSLFLGLGAVVALCHAKAANIGLHDS